MSTPVQKNLVEKNQEYASSFNQGDLSSPPSKKYAIEILPNATQNLPPSPKSTPHQSSHPFRFKSNYPRHHL
ncbi:MAG: hypothetical protein L6R39_007742 [Caloplaca ligustica]|nr:MAG: hypothetical protein L6R39_007742 [Caloplaca ligustica]